MFVVYFLKYKTKAHQHMNHSFSQESIEQNFDNFDNFEKLQEKLVHHNALPYVGDSVFIKQKIVESSFESFKLV